MAVLEVSLTWQGPYGLSSTAERSSFSPPGQAGIYLWTVLGPNGYRISYIGETGNLWDRMNSHLTSLLGGAYCLYGDDHLISGEPPCSKTAPYRAGLRNVLDVFLNEYDTYSRLALKNVTAYTMFWATTDMDRPTRRAIEAALIEAAYDQDLILQNDRPRPDNFQAVHLTNVGPSGINIEGLRPTCQFGAQG